MNALMQRVCVWHLPFGTYNSEMNLTSATVTADQAREMLKGKAERLTEPRITVLSALLQAKSALTQAEVHTSVEKLNANHIDRVTIYRVLEWLTEVGLAHRVSGGDRVFRFSASIHSHSHGHFHCSDCGRMFCIEAQQSKKAADLNASLKALLPTGFVGSEIDLTISGRCAECA
jgi:Fur family transcriptional regulator, ferric uptake regulator